MAPAKSAPRLKPCPFCGAKPEYDKDQEDYFVQHTPECYFSYIERYWVIDNAQSTWAWNRRATPRRKTKGGK
jgi:hypothetical protein